MRCTSSLGPSVIPSVRCGGSGELEVVWRHRLSQFRQFLLDEVVPVLLYGALNLFNGGILICRGTQDVPSPDGIPILVERAACRTERRAVGHNYLEQFASDV